jgi:hypothetical protein
MIAPKLPSFFKTSPHRRFSFKTRYYDKRKEELKKNLLQKNSSNKSLNSENLWGPNSRVKSNKNSNRTILLFVLALLVVSYLLLK